MKLWFTSDTHFNSIRTKKFSKRPFKTVDEMDNEMVKRWNSVVKKGDIVYHLGDFGDYSFAKKLNGEIRLLRGNYDRNTSDYEEWVISEYITDLGNNSSYPIFLEDENPSFYLCHEPTNRVKDSFNLFGHIHKLQMVKYNGLNVGVDCHNFYPIDLETVRFYRNAIENFYDKEVFGQ